jgi:hypothetical protein
MRPRILRIVQRGLLPTGNFRSLPSEIGVTSPAEPLACPRHWVHPQEMTGTVGFGVQALEPGNDSNLALECLPESPSDPVAG